MNADATTLTRNVIRYVNLSRRSQTELTTQGLQNLRKGSRLIANIRMRITASSRKHKKCGDKHKCTLCNVD